MGMDLLQCTFMEILLCSPTWKPDAQLPSSDNPLGQIILTFNQPVLVIPQ